MTTVYAVFQHGVYRHECGGIFLNEDVAIDHADHLAETDGDGYHFYEVVPFELSREYQHNDPGTSFSFPKEPDSIYTVSKGKPGVRKP